MEDFIFCEVVIFFEIKDSLEIKNDFWLQSLPKNRLERSMKSDFIVKKP